MSPSPTSRRIFLAAGTSAAVFASLRAAADAEADPIFAAIERHQRAHAVYVEACNFTDHALAEQEGRVVTAADTAAFEAASGEDSDALEALAVTPPTTKAGARAALEYLAQVDHGAWLEDFVDTLVASPVLA